MLKLLPPKIFTCQNPVFVIEKTVPSQGKSMFEKAVAESHTLLLKNAEEIMILLYSLYKQATEGDIHIPMPQNPADEAALAKYKAWYALKGKSASEAKKDYIKLVNSLKE